MGAPPLEINIKNKQDDDNVDIITLNGDLVFPTDNVPDMVEGLEALDTKINLANRAAKDIISALTPCSNISSYCPSSSETATVNLINIR